MIATAKPAESRQERHYWVFQLFFMFGFLFHAAEEWDHPHETVLVIMAIWSFLQFDRFREWIFLAFIALLSFRNLEKFPLLANHSNVLLFICLFLMPNQLRRCFGTIGEATERTTQSLRWIVLFVYFFAGFHKLNWDFFNPEVTCSFDKMQDYLMLVGWRVYDLPDAVQAFVPLSVVIMELLPALLFLFGKTQKIGVLMILLIHALLAPVGFADFSSIGQSMLWLFVPAAAMHRLPGRWYYSFMAAVFVFMHLFLASDRMEYGDSVHTYLEGFILLACFAPVWICYFRARIPGVSMTLPKTWFHRGAVLFIVFFAMNNYLGLRTAGTLSMFSNLITEGERSNHILLGSNPIKIFGFQEDVIEIIDVDRRVRNKYRRALREGNKIPRVEFARILDRLRAKDILYLDMTVRYEGETFSTTDLVYDEEFDFPVPWWQKKLLQFRPIQAVGPQECRW